MFSKIKKPVSVLLALLMTLSVFGCLAITAGAEDAPENDFVVGSTIQFGSYPQTKVSSAELIAELENVEKNWVSYRYYARPADAAGGSTSATSDPNESAYNGEMQPGDWMRFADFSYNSEKYRAVEILEYRPHATQYTTGYNSKQQANGYTLGIYYFKYEPLSWRVLDPETGFVLCERIIDCQPYQNFVYAVGKNDLRQGKTEPGFGRFANNYEGSTIRAWLNFQFYETAFTDAQKSNVKLTTIKNTADLALHSSPDTQEKVFMLSTQELTSSKYGFSTSPNSNASRAAHGTDYAYSQNLCGTNMSGSYVDSYWVRTPSDYHLSLSAYRVFKGGEINKASWVTDDYTGVRPACCLNVLKNDDTISEDLFSAKRTITLSPGTLGGDAVTAQDAVWYTLPEAETLFTVPEDQVFTGWLAEDNETVYAAGTEICLSGDVSFTAQWADAVTVTFDAAGGTAVEPQKIAVNTAPALPKKPEKDGSVFKGWRLDGAFYDFAAPVTESVTLHAVWTEGKSILQSFDTEALPDGWTLQSTGVYGWEIGKGDSLNSIGTHSGESNLKARYKNNTHAGDEAWLISPTMDLHAYPTASIRFWYINRRNLNTNKVDKFSVFYRVNGGEWQALFATEEAHETWTEQIEELPAAALKAGVQFGFRATYNDSYGVGLDDVDFDLLGTHNVTYTAAGNVLTATCRNNPCALENNKLSLMLNAPEKTLYGDGKAAEATLTELGRFNLELDLSISESDIRYYKGDALLSAAPTDAGDYTASLTVNIGSASYTITKSYSIAREQAAYEEVPTGLGAVYGDTLRNVTLPEGWSWETPGTGVGNVGEHTFAAKYSPDPVNYNYADAELTVNVTPKTVTVIADGQSKIYGDADPDLTYTAEGLLEGDVFEGALTRDDCEDVGVYGITQGTLTAGGNYNISFTGADFTITEKTLTVTAEAKSKTYGDADPELTYTVSGLVEGDALTGALTRASGEDVGEYAITLGTLTAGRNYVINYTGASLTVGRRTLTVTANAAAKVYGDNDPALTWTQEGLVNGDALSVTLTRAPGRNVGAYPITAQIDAGDNYNVVYVPASLTITKRPVTVTAVPQTKYYGDDDPALTCVIEGLAYDDEISVVLSREPGESGGTYRITAEIDAGGNYEVTFISATMSIEYCPLCGKAHNTKTPWGFIVSYIHLLIFVIRKSVFHMFDYM